MTTTFPLTKEVSENLRYKFLLGEPMKERYNMVKSSAETSENH